MASVHSGKPKAKLRRLPPVKKSPGKVAKNRYKCNNGPYDGEFIWLSEQGTAIFKVGEWHGRYVVQTNAAYWEAVQ